MRSLIRRIFKIVKFSNSITRLKKGRFFWNLRLRRTSLSRCLRGKTTTCWIFIRSSIIRNYLISSLVIWKNVISRLIIRKNSISRLTRKYSTSRLITRKYSTSWLIRKHSISKIWIWNCLIKKRIILKSIRTISFILKVAIIKIIVSSLIRW